MNDYITKFVDNNLIYYINEENHSLYLTGIYNPKIKNPIQINYNIKYENRNYYLEQISWLIFGEFYCHDIPFTFGEDLLHKTKDELIFNKDYLLLKYPGFNYGDYELLWVNKNITTLKFDIHINSISMFLYKYCKHCKNNNIQKIIYNNHELIKIDNEKWKILN